MVTIIVALITTAVPLATLFCNRIDNKNREKKESTTRSSITQEALKIILRHVMEADVAKHKEKGKITLLDLEKFDNSYNVYEKLVGMNGYVEELYREVHELPVE